jgi:catechol 2,3-dioxygenase
MGMAANTIFAPRRLGHSNLWVDDLKRSERFYNQVCGLAVEFWEPDLVATFLGTGNTPHDLGMIEKTGGQPRYGRDGQLQLPPGIGLAPGLNHLAWELENEVALVEAYRKLKAAGLPINLTADHQVAHSIYMPDPDGNEVEYYCDTVKEWRGVLHGEMSLITGLWNPEEGTPFADGRYVLDPEIRTVAEAPVHPRRITHAVLVTADLARLRAFYTEVGGLSQVGAAAGGRVLYLCGSQQGYAHHLVLVAGSAPAYHHSSFELENEVAVDQAESRLTAQGIVPVKSLNTAWKRSFFLRDPDGLLTEYYAARTGPRDLSAADPDLGFLV